MGGNGNAPKLWNIERFFKNMRICDSVGAESRVCGGPTYSIKIQYETMSRNELVSSSLITEGIVV